jgi:tetratricopeptide (TPR) repeat protein
MRNVLALYRDVTRQIADEIHVALTPETERRLAGARPVDPEALQANLRGWFHLERINPTELETALQYFQLALEKDSLYAAPYAGIAVVWATRMQIGLVPTHVANPRATAAAERALRLDSTVAEAQMALAAVWTWGEWNWSVGEAAFRRSIALNPNAPLTRAGYSHLLAILQRPDEAIAQIQQAVDLDPHNPLVRSFYAGVLMNVDRYDEAVTQADLALRQAPNHVVALSVRWGALHAGGRYKEALEAAKAWAAGRGDRELVDALTREYAQTGYEGAMGAAADGLAARAETGFVAPTLVARLYAVGGENDRALEWLERDFRARAPNMPYVAIVPAFDGLHDEPRFQDLLRRMNLPQ